MARRRKTTPTAESPSLAEPWQSVEPADWFMYCDLLQDCGDNEQHWLRARRIAESLAINPRLVIVNYCPASALQDHWLRLGETWFIGADGTYIEKNRLAWWRPAWVRDGFARYPYDEELFPRREVEVLLARNLGTPWEMPHPRWERLQKRRRTLEKARRAFFDGHALHEMPAEYR